MFCCFFRRAQAQDPAGTTAAAEGDAAPTAKAAAAVAQTESLLQQGVSKLSALGQRLLATKEVRKVSGWPSFRGGEVESVPECMA